MGQKSMAVWRGLFVGLVLFLQVNAAADTALTFYLSKFANNTNCDYLVSYRERAMHEEQRAIVSESANWRPLLLLKAHESGEMEFLLRDPDEFGGQVMLAPYGENSQNLPTIYLRGGIKASGDCVQNWYNGPYSIMLTTDEKALEKQFKDPSAVRRVRYCGYHNTYGGITIEPDGVFITVEHNMKILDQQKILFAEFGEKGKNDEK